MEFNTVTGSHTRALPRSYSELTTRVYERIFREWGMEPPIEERDYAHLFTILYDEPGTIFRAGSVEVEEIMWQKVRWVVEQAPALGDALPKTFVLGGNALEVPEKVGALSFGQNIVLRQLLDKGKYLNEFIGMAIAIYLQPLADGAKFSKARAFKLYETEIAQRPISETFALGFFLLTHVRTGGQQSQSEWLRTLSNLITRLRNRLQRWLLLRDLNRTRIYPR